MDETTTTSKAKIGNDDALEAYREMSFGMAWAMLVICVVSVVTNVLSICVYTHPSMRRTPINILLTALSGIDLSLSLLAIPAFIVPGFFTYYQTWTLELIMCYSAVFIYPLTSTTHTASVWTFVVIAMERWYAVCGGGRDMASIGRQRSLLRRKRRRTVVFALITVCILSLAYNVVRFFEFELKSNDAAVFQTFSESDSESIRNSAANLSDKVSTVSPISLYTIPMVVPLLRNATIHPFYMRVYYVGLYLVTHFAVPFVSLVIVNGLTLRIVYIAQQRRKRLLTRRERKEHQTTRMMVTVVVMFILCYTLVFTLNIIEAVDNDWFHTDENRLMAYSLNDISNMLVITNAASTAFVYYFFNRRYRELCLALISKLFACLSSWCCWCSWCWCRRACQECLNRRQRVLDRRRSTLCSGNEVNETTKNQDEESESFGKKHSFLVVPSFSLSKGGRRYSSNSTLDNKEGLMTL